MAITKGAPAVIDLPREERFMRLFLANERRIHGFLLALVPRWDDVDDLLQETAAVIWRKLDEFEPGTDFAAWALSIARFQVLSYRKKQNRERCRYSDKTVEALAEHWRMLDEQRDWREEALCSCLGKLSTSDNELIRLRYQPGATTQMVAEQAGRSAGAVYKALNRIHQQLLLCIRRTLNFESGL